MSINAPRGPANIPSLPTLLAAIDLDTAADHEIVAAPGADKRITITAVRLVIGDVSNSDVLVTLKSATTALSGPMLLSPESTQLNWADVEDGLFRCAENEALNLTLSAAVQVSGVIHYVIETL